MTDLGTLAGHLTYDPIMGHLATGDCCSSSSSSSESSSSSSSAACDCPDETIDITFVWTKATTGYDCSGPDDSGSKVFTLTKTSDCVYTGGSGYPPTIIDYVWEWWFAASITCSGGVWSFTSDLELIWTSGTTYSEIGLSGTGRTGSASGTITLPGAWSGCSWNVSFSW